MLFGAHRGLIQILAILRYPQTQVRALPCQRIPLPSTNDSLSTSWGLGSVGSCGGSGVPSADGVGGVLLASPEVDHEDNDDDGDDENHQANPHDYPDAAVGDRCKVEATAD